MKHLTTLLLALLFLGGCSSELNYVCSFNETLVSKDRSYIQYGSSVYYKVNDFGTSYIYGDKTQAFTFYPKSKRLTHARIPSQIQREFGRTAQERAGVVDCEIK